MADYYQEHHGANPRHGTTYHYWRNVNAEDQTSWDTGDVNIVPYTSRASIMMGVKQVSGDSTGLVMGIAFRLIDEIRGVRVLSNIASFANAPDPGVGEDYDPPVFGRRYNVNASSNYLHYNYFSPRIGTVSDAAATVDILVAIYPVNQNFDSGSPFF